MDGGAGPGGLQRAARAGPASDAGRRGVRGGRSAVVSAARARDLHASAVYRRTLASEQELPAFRAPDGTEVFLGPVPTDGDEAAWVPEFEGGHDPQGSLLTGVDHVNLSEPWQCFDEAVLFYSSVLGLTPSAGQEVPSLRGLVRSQVVRSDSGALPTGAQRRSAGLGPRRRPPPARRVRHRRRRHRRAPGGRARSGPARHPTELLRRPARPLRPVDGRGRRRWPGSACSTTAMPPATSRTSTRPRSATSSSRSCSAAGATTATAHPTPGVRLAAQHRHAGARSVSSQTDTGH